MPKGKYQDPRGGSRFGKAHKGGSNGTLDNLPGRMSKPSAPDSHFTSGASPGPSPSQRLDKASKP